MRPSSNVHFALGTAMLSLQLVAGNISCSAAADTDGERVDAQQVEVINGTNVTSQSQNPGVVALYHQSICESDNPYCSPLGSYYWFPRPCSATILRAWKNETWILTARHCVTTDGNIGSTVLAANRMRINTGLTPGIISSAPPAGSLTVDQVVAPTIPASPPPLSALDVAVVRVPQVLTAPVIRTALSFDPTEDLPGKQGIGFGYGRFVDGGNEFLENGSSGAGRLRKTGGLPILDDYSCPVCGYGYYVYQNLTSSNQSLWRGDSGGPTFLTSTTFWYQVGVHSSAEIGGDSKDASVSDLSAWIQNAIGYVHVSSMATPSFNLSAGTGSPANLTSVTTSNLKAPLSVRWVYDHNTRRIYTKGSDGVRYYLHAYESDILDGRAFVSSSTHASLHHEWFMSSGRIVSWNLEGCAVCLTERSDKSVGVECCETKVPAQTWAWHPQP